MIDYDTFARLWAVACPMAGAAIILFRSHRRQRRADAVLAHIKQYCRVSVRRDCDGNIVAITRETG